MDVGGRPVAVRFLGPLWDPCDVHRLQELPLAVAAVPLPMGTPAKVMGILLFGLSQRMHTTNRVHPLPMTSSHKSSASSPGVSICIVVLI